MPEKPLKTVKGGGKPGKIELKIQKTKEDAETEEIRKQKNTENGRKYRK